MSVYVDPLFQHGVGSYHGTGRAQATRVGARNKHFWCHLFADTEEELHELAGRIGLLRLWFQGDHYDLTPGRRAQAVKAGAIEVDRRKLAEFRRDRRNQLRAAELGVQH